MGGGGDCFRLVGGGVRLVGGGDCFRLVGGGRQVSGGGGMASG